MKKIIYPLAIISIIGVGFFGNYANAQPTEADGLFGQYFQRMVNYCGREHDVLVGFKGGASVGNNNDDSNQNSSSHSSGGLTQSTQCNGGVVGPDGTSCVLPNSLVQSTHGNGGVVGPQQGNSSSNQNKSDYSDGPFGEMICQGIDAILGGIPDGTEFNIGTGGDNVKGVTMTVNGFIKQTHKSDVNDSKGVVTNELLKELVPQIDIGVAGGNGSSVTFSKTFSSSPDVIVMPTAFVHTNRCRADSASFEAKASNVSTTGFIVSATQRGECGGAASVTSVAYIAIGQAAQMPTGGNNGGFGVSSGNNGGDFNPLTESDLESENEALEKKETEKEIALINEVMAPKIKELEDKIKKLEQKDKELQGKITQLEARLTERLKDIDGRINNMSNGIVGLQNDIYNINGSINSIWSSINSIWSSMQ